MATVSKSSKMLVASLLIVGMLTRDSQQSPGGAPSRACVDMLPRHPDTSLQTSASPYSLATSGTQVHQGGLLNVTLYSPGGAHLEGFMLQARGAQPSIEKPLGSWITSAPYTKTTSCNGTDDTVTHSSKAKKYNLVFSWRAPEDFLGSVNFRATGAQDYAQYWSKIESPFVEVVTRDTKIASRPNVELPAGKMPSETIKPPVDQPPPQQTTYDPFYVGCGSTKLCFGNRPTCVAEQNCNAAVTVTVRGETYTFELKAKESPAYVAVGLSSDTIMGDDSAMECQQVNGRVTGHTSWTYPKSDPYVSRENVPQNIMQLLSSSYEDGVLSCKFTRDVRSTVRGTVFDLAKDQYHIMIVSGSKVNANSVGFHDKVFEKTAEKVSLAEVQEVAGASKLLLRLHGAFMLAAWIGTASCGILLARYYRQTWVGKSLGGKDIWFSWHRIFMICTWLLTMAAFIIILVEVGGWGGTGDNPHAIIGMVTIVLCFLQPIGAFFRPHPNTPKRPIFNWGHWLAGNAAHILGIVTIFFAVSLNKAELPSWMTYILVAFVVFHVIMHIILSIGMCVSDGRISNGRVNSFPMKDLLSNNRPPLNNDRKIDAPNAGFRKLILGIFFVVIILFVVALVCIICLAPIEETYNSVSKAINSNP